jgi:hypothetical protein
LRGTRDTHGRLLALDPAKRCFKPPKVRKIGIAAPGSKFLVVLILRTSGFRRPAQSFRRVSRANALAVAFGGMLFRVGRRVRFVPRMGEGICGIDRPSCRGTHG